MPPSPGALLLLATLAAPFDPPWHAAPPGLLDFAVPGVENAPDLHGDPCDADLVLLLGGNQFMVLPDLVAALQRRHPEIRRVFYETLPAGIVAEQLDRGGGLRVGDLEIHVRADVFASGPGRMEKLRAAGLVEAPVTYATNDLAILVRAGNPKGVRGLADLARGDLRLSLPDPKIEGIGRQIAQALERAGGPALREAVLERKVREGTTTLTRIHHRQTPLAILEGAADAGVVWSTEARFQRRLGHPLEAIAIPARQNATGSYQAAVVRGAPHPAAAKAFLELLRSDEGQAIYRSFGFAPPG